MLARQYNIILEKVQGVFIRAGMFIRINMVYRLFVENLHVICNPSEISNS